MGFFIACREVLKNFVNLLSTSNQNKNHSFSDALKYTAFNLQKKKQQTVGTNQFFIINMRHKLSIITSQRAY